MNERKFGLVLLITFAFILIIGALFVLNVK
jgi:hypothetical protein